MWPNVQHMWEMNDEYHMNGANWYPTGPYYIVYVHCELVVGCLFSKSYVLYFPEKIISGT